jgi:hypothetical protein
LRAPKSRLRWGDRRISPLVFGPLWSIFSPAREISEYLPSLSSFVTQKPKLQLHVGRRNVWEWCRNEYSDPKVTKAGGDESRVLRGGSWIRNQDFARAAFRVVPRPSFRNDYLGFRVVCVSRIRSDR